MTRKILCVSHNQFGYQINIFHYIKYLKERYDFSYVCFDYGYEKLELPEVDVSYLSRTGSYYRELFFLLKRTRKLLMEGEYDLVILKYLPFSSLFRLISTEKFLLQVDSVGVSENKWLNTTFDTLLKLESRMFPIITALSKGLAERLRLPPRRTHIIPLGAEQFSTLDHEYDKLRLLYIGTLNWRRIPETIIGFYRFYQSCKVQNRPSYTIIGYGYQTEIDHIMDCIKKLDLKENVEYVGVVPYSKLTHYFERCNVGVSYIPITPEYDIQPPTKTIEYLLSGLPTIATATSENKKLITDQNGVLIDDTSQAFFEGLCKMTEAGYNNSQIRKSMEKFRWENIVQVYLQPILDEIFAETQ